MTPKTGEVWVHYKTKGEYKILGIGKLQAKTELDMADCVIYQNESNGEFWIRPLVDFVEVFEDGTPRFTKRD